MAPSPVAPPRSRMPAAFLGHGSPMNTLENNRYTEAWKTLGACVPKPRAILVVSAHWYVPFTAVTAMARPRTIHDFFGFPEELFAVEYPAPGDADVAGEIVEVCKPTRVGLDRDTWGLDHGTWSVLVHAFPAADIPVLQLALDARRDLEHHFEVGVKLAALRDKGVLVIGSGNVVHNLRALRWSEPDGGADWARRFDESARAAMTGTPDDVLELASHPDFERAVPTLEHFLPLLYLAGLASAQGTAAKVLIDGYAYSSLSMTAYTLDASCPADTADERPAAGLPDPARVPAEETNL